MILGDIEIVSRVAEQGDEYYIGIDPYPEPEQFQPASLDIRMGEELVDPMHDRYQESPFEVHPGIPYIGTTLERIELPNDVAAMMTGRSTMGRKGIIVHKTAGWIDPGFRGTVTLEMYNFTDYPIEVEAGDRVAQLVFFQVDGVSDGYDGQYQDQEGAETAGDL